MFIKQAPAGMPLANRRGLEDQIIPIVLVEGIGLEIGKPSVSFGMADAIEAV